MTRALGLLWQMYEPIELPMPISFCMIPKDTFGDPIGVPRMTTLMPFSVRRSTTLS